MANRNAYACSSFSRNGKLIMATKVDLLDFTRKLDALSRAYTTLPNEIAAVAVNFSKECFVSQSWLDTTKENWKQRKRDRLSKNGNKTKNQTLLVQTGRLKRSIRKIKADESQIVIGTDVPYAQIHNEGGTINKSVAVKAHTVKSHSRTRKGRKEQVKEFTVRAHARKMNTTIPRRQFLGESYTLSKRIINLITARFARALKT